MSLRGASVVRALPVSSLLIGSGLITASSLAYFSDEELPAFVIEKLPLPLEALWLFALKVHVVSAALALPGCIALSTVALLRLAPRAHRWVGRVTGAVVLLGLCPSGLYLSFFAKGGALATAGFVASGLVVLVAMVQAVRLARAKDFAAHRRAALHVLAQLSVAVSSRAMLVGLDALGFDAESAYLVSLWLPVVGSAVLVELICPRRRFTFNSTIGRRHEQSVVDPHHHLGDRGVSAAKA